MPETTTTQLTESDVAKVEQRLKAWIAGDIPHTQYPASWADVDALIRDWRALKAALEAEDKDHRLTIDTFRQQERIWNQRLEEQEQSNAALREQLAATKNDLELARQSLLKMCDAMENRL